MAKYSHTIDYKLTTSLDASGINKLQSELRKAEQELQRMSGMNLIDPMSANKAIRHVQEIDKAMTKAFNPKIGMLNVEQFSKSLKATNNSIVQWKQSFDLAGTAGQQAFASLIGRIGKVDTGLKAISSTADKVFNTIGNTVRWGLVASGFQTIMNSAYRAVDYVKDLDKSLNNIRIVTDYSAKDMREFALEANNAAQALGQTTVNYTDAALIYAQQGKNLEESKQLAELTLKVANTTGQNTAEVSEQITSWMNGYQMSIEQVGKTLDSVTKVAAIGAADTEELMTAASKVASSAHMLGVSENELIAQMSTIISVTREAPENVGNALKTIYARMGDLKTDGETDDGVKLGKIAKAMKEAGVNIMDTSGNMRNMGEVIEELMQKWQGLGQAQKQALAIDIAGKYQYGRFTALMENMSMYKEQLDGAADSAGFLERTQSIYMESIEAKTKALQTSFEGLINDLLDPDSAKPFLEVLTKIVNLLDNMTKAAGGGLPVLTALFGISAKLFSGNIAKGITNFVSNRKNNREVKAQSRARADMMAEGLNSEQIDDPSMRKRLAFGVNINKNTRVLSSEDIERQNQLAQNFTNNQLRKIALLKEQQMLENEINLKLQQEFGITEKIVQVDKNHNLNYQEYLKMLSTNVEIKGKMSSLLSSAQGKQFDSASRILSKTELIGDRKDFKQRYLEGDQDTLKYTKNYESLLNKQSERLINSGMLSEKQVQLLQQATYEIKRANVGIDDVDKSWRLVSSSQRKAAQVAQEIVETYYKVAGVVDDQIVQSIERYNAEMQEALALEETLQHQIDITMSDNDNSARIANISDMVGSLGQLAFAWQSVQSLGALFADKDIDNGERLLQIIMNLSMTLPMMVSAFRMLPGATSFGGGLIAAANTKQNKADRYNRASVVVENRKQEELKKAQQLKNEGKQLSAEEILVRKDLENKNYWGANAGIPAQKKQQAVELKLQSQEKYRLAAQAETRAAELDNASKKATNLGAQAAQGAKGLKLLGGALNALGGPIGLTIMGFQAISGIISYVIQSNQQAYEEAKKTKDEAIASFESIAPQVEQFNELYKSWDGSAESGKNLKDTAKALAKELKIIGADALIATNNFIGLANAINKANNTKLNKAKQETRAFLDGAGKQSIEGGWFQNGQLLDGSATFDLKNSFGGVDNSFLQIQGQTVTMHKNNKLGDKFDNAKNFGQVYAIAAEELDNLNKQRDELQAQIDKNPNDANLQTKKNTLDKKISDGSKALSDEHIQEYMQSLEKYASLDIQSKLHEGTAISSVEGVFKSLDNTSKKYLDSISDWGEKLQFIIQNTTDETLKQKLMLEQSYVTSGQKLYGMTKQLVDNGDIQAASGSPSMSAEETANAVSRYVLDKIKTSGMTNEEQINFMATIDETQSLASIMSKLDEIKKNPEIADKLILSMKLDNKFDLTESEIDNISKEAGMSRNAFNRMAEDINNNDKGIRADKTKILNDMQQARNERSQLVQENETTKSKVTKYKNDKNIEQLDKKLQELGETYQEVSKRGQKLAAVNTRMNKGVSDLVSSWDELGSVLKNKANKGTSEWYKALDQLDGILSNILNIDQGTLSNDFLENNVELMDRIVAGGDDAVQAMADLRKASTQDLVANMAITPIEGSSSEDGRATLESIMNDWQAALDATPIEARAGLNTDEYVSKLNEMIASGQITAQQATQVLSSAGYVGELETVSMKATVPVVRYTTHGNILDLISGNGNFYVDAVTSMEEIPDAKIQVLKGANQADNAYTPAPASLNSGKKSAKGGGGGGGSSKKAKPKDFLENELDKYERVNALLANIEANYERINKQRERLSGNQVVDFMIKEAGLLERNIKLLQQKLEIQKLDIQERKKELASKFGAQFDADGVMLNYADIYKQYLDKANAAISAYNAAGEDVSDDLQDSMDKTKEDLDKFKNAHKEYTDLVTKEYQDSLNAIEDLRDQQEDMNISLVRSQMEAIDSIKELNDTMARFQGFVSGMKKDDPFRSLLVSSQGLDAFLKKTNERSNDYQQRYFDKLKKNIETAKKTGEYTQEQIAWMESKLNPIMPLDGEDYNLNILDPFTESSSDVISQSLKNILNLLGQIDEFEAAGVSSIFGENSGELYSMAQEAFGMLVDNLEEMEDKVGEFEDAIISALDDVFEKIDERTQQFENITAELEHQKELVTMIKGEAAYDQIGLILQAQQDVFANQIKHVKNALTEMQNLLKTLDKESTEYKNLQKKIIDTQSTLNDLIKQSLETIREEYENTVNKIMDSWSDKAFRSMDEQGKEIVKSLDYMTQEWELINSAADRYLDQTNATYNIQKLQQGYIQALDSTADANAQAMITEQMKEQLAYLREKKNLSEYDVAYANAQLEILQKRIALEEAQRNKNQMKLRRDAQGNYTYTYSANKTETANAESELLDAQNNAYNLSKENLRTLQDNALSALGTAKSAIMDLWNNANISADEKAKRTELIISNLQSHLSDAAIDLKDTQTNLLNDFIGLIDLTSEENRSHVDTIYQGIKEGNTDLFNQIDARWSTSITAWLGNVELFNDSTNNMFETLKQNYKSYAESIETTAGENVGTFEQVSDAVAKVKVETDDLVASQNEFNKALSDSMSTISRYEDQLAGYRGQISLLKGEMNKYAADIDELNRKLKVEEEDKLSWMNRAKTFETNIANFKAGTHDIDGNPLGSGGAGGASKAVDRYIINLVAVEGAYGNGQARVDALRRDGYSAEEVQAAVDLMVNKYYNAWRTGRGWESALSAEGFDTGGYTGDFEGGKLAMLHQKELVLNSTDTENIFKAVDAARQITSQIQAGALGQIASAINKMINFATPGGGDIQQDIQINAEFPGVSVASEIENAFANMAEQALQYSTRIR